MFTHYCADQHQTTPRTHTHTQSYIWRPHDSTHLHFTWSHSAGSCTPLIGCSLHIWIHCVSVTFFPPSQTLVKCWLLAGNNTSHGTWDDSMIRQTFLWEDIKLCTPRLCPSSVCMCVWVCVVGSLMRNVSRSRWGEHCWVELTSTLLTSVVLSQCHRK